MGPWSSVPAAKSFSVNEPSFTFLPVIVLFLIFTAVTAFFFNCFAPTELRGNCDTAYDVPLIATISAITATTRAGEGDRMRRV